jgi:hypothetical protein
LLFDLTTDPNMTFDQAVDAVMKPKIPAPCYVVMANNFNDSKTSKYGAGVVITRGRESVDNLETIKYEAGSAKWYITATNLDIWNPEVHDKRYDLVN